MARRFLWVLFGIMLLVSIFGFQVDLGVGEEERDFGRQITQILENQKKILQDLEEIKKELTVVRVRVS